jgi:hypothetical protein
MLLVLPSPRAALQRLLTNDIAHGGFPTAALGHRVKFK